MGEVIAVSTMPNRESPPARRVASGYPLKGGGTDPCDEILNPKHEIRISVNTLLEKN